jgi:hypothetical protein
LGCGGGEWGEGWEDNLISINVSIGDVGGWGGGGGVGVMGGNIVHVIGEEQREDRD